MKIRILTPLALAAILISTVPADGPTLQIRRAFTGVTPTSGEIPVVLELRGYAEPISAVACRFQWLALPQTDIASADFAAEGTFAAEDGVTNNFSPTLGNQPQNVTGGRTRSFISSSFLGSAVADEILRFGLQAPSANATIDLLRSGTSPFVLDELVQEVPGVTARGIKVLPGLDPQAEVVNRLLGKAVATPPELLDASFDTDSEGAPAPVLDAADVALTAAVL